MTQRQMSPTTMCDCALLSFAFAVSAPAQPTRWKEYVSEKGKFSVLLPGDPETDYRLGDPDSVTRLIYLINYQEDGVFWDVECFDLHAIPPDADAAKKLLERRRDKYSSASESAMLSLNGYPALEYKMRIDRHGVEIGRIILIRRRIYQLRVFTLTPANNFASETTKFFDSFKPTPMTDEEVISATQTARKSDSRALMVANGVLQGIAVKKVQPIYPPEVKAARAAVAAKIRILISEEGNVIDAEVLDCPDLLRESALTAARLWTFRPTELAGKPVKIEGVLTIKFAPR